MVRPIFQRWPSCQWLGVFPGDAQAAAARSEAAAFVSLVFAADAESEALDADVEAALAESEADVALAAALDALVDAAVL